MADTTIYQTIAQRTGGDIYIGVTGPVRTGKSTCIRRILDTTVLPCMTEDAERIRTEDEMPQSANGKTVTTTEPKFIPGEAVHIQIGGADMRVKLIDCVGYVVDGALGTEEEGADRLVKTPWSDVEIPFSEAAKIGTEKVIREHATVGLLITTDGTVCDIPRENYIQAEERALQELKGAKKPFCIILNSAHPETEEAKRLAASLEEKYQAPVALVNATTLSAEDVQEIFGLLLQEFPIRSLSFSLPTWMDVLPKNHPLYRSLLDEVDAFSDRVHKLGDLTGQMPSTEGAECEFVHPADGSASYRLPVSKEVFYQTLADYAGVGITDERDLLVKVRSMADAQRAYEKVEKALQDVNEKGYGIVMPAPDELTFDEPELVKQSGGYGVKVTAKAESIHMIRAGLQAEIRPMVGTEEQADEIVKYLQSEFEEDPEKIKDSHMFGKSIYDLVNDSLTSKLDHIPADSREKLGETLERILNEGANGLICILV